MFCYNALPYPFRIMLLPFPVSHTKNLLQQIFLFYYKRLFYSMSVFRGAVHKVSAFLRGGIGRFRCGSVTPATEAGFFLLPHVYSCCSSLFYPVFGICCTTDMSVFHSFRSTGIRCYGYGSAARGRETAGRPKNSACVPAERPVNASGEIPIDSIGNRYGGSGTLVRRCSQDQTLSG